jgi:hypothetical protein
MITVGIASIPQREASLKMVLDSLTNQVDQMNIVLNGYDHVPDYLNSYKNAWWMIADNSMGDAMKFYTIPDGVYLGADDDLLYPNGYVSYMVSKSKEYSCPVSLAGKRFDNHPVQSYHSGFTKNYHCLKPLIGDYPVHVIGTGVCCFHTSQIVIYIDDFKTPNMADVWFALQAKEQKVPLMVVEHTGDYLKYIPQDWTIWRNNPRKGMETEIINKILAS